MARPDGGWITKYTAPTAGAARGVWSLRDVFASQAAASWPLSQFYDPLFSSVSLLLHFDNAGTTFTDSSSAARTVSRFGDATQSAAQAKFGTYSLYLDGSGDYLTVSTSAAFGFGTGDFCLEYFWYPTRNVINETLLDTRGSDTTIPLVLGKSVAGAVRCYDGTTVRTGGTMTLNAWNYVAWARTGNNHNVYLNGNNVISFTSSFDAGSNRNLTIGANASVSFENCQGFIDEIRITKGSGRGYTGPSIPVPVSAFFPS